MVGLDYILGRKSLLGGETLEKVVQRSCGSPTPGSVQGLHGGFEQPGEHLEGVLAYGRGAGIG